MTKAKFKLNPYIVGRPISERELFFGHQNLFAFIEDNLKQGVQVILLSGQRRIGKSSLIFQIPKFVAQDEFAFVHFDLDPMGRLSLSNLLHSLAEEILANLELDPQRVKLPSSKDFSRDYQLFSQNFLPQVYRELGKKNLVLLLDEFEVLTSYEPTSSAKHFFPYLQSILKEQKRLFIIPVVGRKPDDLPKLLGLFREAPHREIGLLDRVSSKRLITEPARNDLVYESDAVEAILELSSCHPYFTQVICYGLFARARSEDNWQVTRDRVASIVDEAIEISEGGLAWFRDALSIPERVVFSAVAEVQEQGLKNKALPFLRQQGIIPTQLLRDAEDKLVNWKFLQLKRYNLEATQPTYIHKITIELVRLWLLEQHPIWKEIWELEKENSSAKSIYELAVKLHQNGDLSNAVKLYEHVLEINPNYLSALFDLAEAYRGLQNFSAAVQFYQRAYQVDPVRVEEELVDSLLNYGNDLMQKKEFPLAKQQFSQALKVEPNQELALQKLEELEAGAN